MIHWLPGAPTEMVSPVRRETFAKASKREGTINGALHSRRTSSKVASARSRRHRSCLSASSTTRRACSSAATRARRALARNQPPENREEAAHVQSSSSCIVSRSLAASDATCGAPRFASSCASSLSRADARDMRPPVSDCSDRSAAILGSGPRCSEVTLVRALLVDTVGEGITAGAKRVSVWKDGLGGRTC